ncbi:hypothetical protein KY346_03035 [Candidatus Woesearchaeota archaeon]|nr:hypothetical protein [Candidatus Woesearchaeota archaeon]
MKKRGQGLPITTIIIAALALIVLVVLIFIFSGKIRVFSGEMVSCTSKGGFCTSKACVFGYQSEIKNTDCPSGQKCCLTILGAPADSPCANDDDCAKGLECKNNKCTAKTAAKK